MIPTLILVGLVLAVAAGRRIRLALVLAAAAAAIWAAGLGVVGNEVSNDGTVLDLVLVLLLAFANTLVGLGIGLAVIRGISALRAPR